MPNSSDPERYSIDEMMDRLQSRSGSEDLGDGKLVTRADGSKAIRVKRKKRRTHQEKDVKKRRRQKVRMIQITAAIVVVAMLVIALGFATIYVNGAPFRKEVEHKIQLNSGANVELAQFRMNPIGANAGSLHLDWPSGNFLGSLSLGGLRAKVSPISLFGGAFIGQEMSADRGVLVMHMPDAEGESRFYSFSGEEQSIRFGEYTIKDFRFQYEGENGVKLVDVTESEAAFIPPNQAKRPQLLLARGNVSISGWPKFVLDRAHIEFVKGKVEVVGMRLRNDKDPSGVMELQGQLDPHTDEVSIFDVSAESYPLSGLIGDDLANFFTGRIDAAPAPGSNILAIECGENPSVAMSLFFRNAIASPLQVSEFPFLFGLSQTLNDEWFSQPSFLDEVSGKIRRVNRQVMLEDLDFAFKGRMAIKGGVTLNASKQLSGTLRVGVTDGMINAADNQVLEAMFGELKEGFRWVELEISGTAADPKDNFRQLYEQLLDTAKSGPAPAVPSFEQLTRPR